MMWKMVTVNTLGREFQKNGAKMHFSLQAQGQKDEKWSLFSSIFPKARLGFHFAFIFLSFSVSILRKMETKWTENETENEPKMARKWLPWTTLLSFQTYFSHINPTLSSVYLLSHYRYSYPTTTILVYTPCHYDFGRMWEMVQKKSFKISNFHDLRTFLHQP